MPHRTTPGTTVREMMPLFPNPTPEQVALIDAALRTFKQECHPLSRPAIQALINAVNLWLTIHAKGGT